MYQTASTTLRPDDGGVTTDLVLTWVGYALAGIGGVFGLFEGACRPGTAGGAWAACIALVCAIGATALVFYAPRRFQTAGKHGPVLNGMMGLPLIGLIYGNSSLCLDNGGQPMLAAALVTALVGLMAAFVCTGENRPDKPWAFAIVWVLLSAFGSYGAIMAVDVRLDPSAGAVFPAEVLGKHSYHGRRSTSYTLELSSWTGQSGTRDVNVGSGTYYGVSVGDHVCVDVHSGLLGMPWLATGRCATGG